MVEEDPAISSTELEVRCGSLNHYISQKIATLNRVKTPSGNKGQDDIRTNEFL